MCTIEKHFTIFISLSLYTFDYHKKNIGTYDLWKFVVNPSPQSTESPASLDRPIGAIFECLIGSKRPVYTSQLQYSVKVATSSYTVQSKYMLVYPGSYMWLDVAAWIYKHVLHVASCSCLDIQACTSSELCSYMYINRFTCSCKGVPPQLGQGGLCTPFVVRH